MGIRGFTTFIEKNSHLYLENFELHDTYLVIDGCSLAAQLYRNNTKSNDAFGGDYDKYKKAITDFFNTLRKCNVNPLVIFDGGYEFKKFKTLLTRLKSKVGTCKSLNPGTQQRYQLFPCMQLGVLCDVLDTLKIQFVMCDYEADYEIAAVARQLNCPVLSYDSDFFIYDCLYVPFTTCELRAHTVNGRSFLMCKLYKVDNFLKRFGGLQKSMLPLMATLLGNDYVKKSTFEKFFATMKLNRSRAPTNDLQRTIVALLDWLRVHDFATAEQKVLSRIKQTERPLIQKVINESVEGYNCSAGRILTYFKLSNENCFMEPNALYKLIDSSDTKQRTFDVPAWFIDKYRCGQLPPSFINLLTKQVCILSPQMEDLTLMHSHSISIGIIRVIFGLLTAAQRYDHFKYVTRSGLHHVKSFKEIPIYGLISLTEFPPLDKLNTLPRDVRNNVLYEVLKLTPEDTLLILSLPEDWRLWVAVIVYWARSVLDIKITTSHLCSLILCAIYIKCLDLKVGYHRSYAIFENRTANKIDALKKQKTDVKVPEEIDEKVVDLLEEVTEGDALMAVNNLLPHFNLNEKLCFNPKNYNVRTVHCYAEFQSAYRQTSYLNRLLEEPFQHSTIADFYNGTFIYNMYINLKKRNDPDVYIMTFLADAYTVLKLYRKLYNIFKKMLSPIFASKENPK